MTNYNECLRKYYFPVAILIYSLRLLKNMIYTIRYPTVSKTDEIVALILARGGSKGVYLKNLQTVGGVSLLARTVHTARAAGLVDVTVSTDHPLIALEALKCKLGYFTHHWGTLPTYKKIKDANQSVFFLTFIGTY